MGCCNLQPSTKKISKFQFFIRKLFFVTVHLSYLSLLSIISLFSSRWRPVLRFYWRYYKNTLKEIKQD